MSEKTRPTIALSVDTECWGQSVLDRSLPIRPRSADNVRRMLDLFFEHGDLRATFFVLGKFAEVHPQVVREIHRAGHEVGSHGYGHCEVFRLSAEEFRADVRRSAAIIEDIIGIRPQGYRAPVFSIRQDTRWALRVLAEEGFIYDSSVFPFWGPRYGIGDWPVEPCRAVFSGGLEIVEYPLTVGTLLGRRFPISGGGYARLLPSVVLRRLIERECRLRSMPPVFYCHPYEIDTEEINRTYPGLPLRRRLHQGLGRRGFLKKLSGVLRCFATTALSESLADVQHLPQLRVAPLSVGERTTCLPATVECPG